MEVATVGRTTSEMFSRMSLALGETICKTKYETHNSRHHVDTSEWILYGSMSFTLPSLGKVRRLVHPK